MQTVIGTGNTGFGPLHYQRGGIIHRHQPRDSTKKKTASSNTFKRNDFLTGRFLPVSSDFYMEDPETETSINLSTRKNFDYLYRSAVNYVNLLGLNLPYPKKKRSSYPRIDIIRLYEVMENLLPENVNLELRDGRLTFCLYHSINGRTTNCCGCLWISRRSSTASSNASHWSSYADSPGITGSGI